jgi:hypothetical protein
MLLFFTSFCAAPVVAPKIAVVLPITVIIFETKGDTTKSVESLSKRYIPAVTIVAACIKADTGVGPSIASGNQKCKPICADLDITAIKKKIQIELKPKEY